MTTIKFQNYTCNFSIHKYQTDDRFAIKLTSAITDLSKELYEGEPIATVTVNMPDIPISSNQLIIKDYSENKGMTEAMINSELIIKETIQKKSFGDGFVVIADMSQKLIDIIDNDPSLKNNKAKKKKP